MQTFHQWALNEVKYCYAGAIKIDTQDIVGKEEAVSIKKHLGILEAIEQFVQHQTDRMLRWLRERLEKLRSIAWFDEYMAIDKPVVQKLVALRTSAKNKKIQAIGKEKAILEELHKLFHTAVKRMTNISSLYSTDYATCGFHCGRSIPKKPSRYTAILNQGRFGNGKNKPAG